MVIMYDCITPIFQVGFTFVYIKNQSSNLQLLFVHMQTRQKYQWYKQR